VCKDTDVFNTTLALDPNLSTGIHHDLADEWVGEPA
jgi:hypothetical protein